MVQDQELISRAGALRVLRESDGGRILLAELQSRKDEIVASIFTATDDGKGNSAEVKYLVARAKAFDEVKDFIEQAIRVGDQELAKRSDA